MTREDMRRCADIVNQTVSALDYAKAIGIPVGRNGFARCFMHSGDNTGSLKLYPGTGGWHCYGCGAHGDVVELARQFYNLSFHDAILKVSEDIGIPLPVRDRYQKKLTVEQEQAIRTANKEKALIEAQQQADEQIEAQYWPVFDDWLAIDRQFTDSEAEICKILKGGSYPDDTLMDKFYDAFAAKLNIEPVLFDLESRRIHA